MMATTELHAVPATIQSRSQVFELKTLPFSVDPRSAQARSPTREKVKIDDAALALVARSAEGSMRDALSALDQVLAFTSDAVTAADVSTVLGLIGRDAAVRRSPRSSRARTLAAVFDARRHGRRSRLRSAHRLPRAGAARCAICWSSRSTRRGSTDPEIAAEGERDRLQGAGRALLARRPDARVRSALARRVRDPQLVAAAASVRDGAGQVDPSAASSTPLERADRVDAKRRAACRSAPAPGAPSGAVARPAAPAAHRRHGQPDQRKHRPAEPLNPREPPGTPRTQEPPVGAAGTPGTAAGRSRRRRCLSSIREQNKMFYGMVVAQAQKVEVEGDTIVFTFAPVHKALRAQLEGKRGWIEQLAQAVAGRKMAVVAREGAAGARRRGRRRRADGRAQGRAPRPREGRAGRAGRARRLRRRNRRRGRD